MTRPVAVDRQPSSGYRWDCSDCGAWDTEETLGAADRGATAHVRETGDEVVICRFVRTVDVRWLDDKERLRERER